MTALLVAQITITILKTCRPTPRPQPPQSLHMVESLSPR